MNFNDWFNSIAAYQPYTWQTDLGANSRCESRVIRIPTGFGKTLGVLSAWLWNRLLRKDDTWPRRLIWCLPMRVLAEQTEAEVCRVLQSMGLLWDGTEIHEGKVGVHLLMGGADAGEWHLHPEHCSVLIGTQDMLLSRSLNRGYGAARARWPMDFGLLNQDCLWVMDEVQLMDVGLATSAQLQAFRHEDAIKSLRPCHTWWMSATLQESWLQSVDTNNLFEALAPRVEIPETERNGGLWEVRKSCEVQAITEEKGIAALALERHQAGTLTLVVVNTVDSARKVHAILIERARAQNVDVRLVHSRFRPHERKSWREDFLQRTATFPDAGRIVVATQVIEAGVDISARTLLTDLAPWPSLVQRFGRCARYVGEAGTVIILDRGWKEKDAKKALPYDLDEVLQARDKLRRLDDVSPASLESYEAELTEADRKTLYPYKPRHLLLRHEWEELFDTSPDLSGADLDISRFIRSGEENDCQVFWREIPAEGPSEAWRPSQEELCSVPFLKAREWLCGKGKDNQALPVKTRSVQDRKVVVAWAWDWVEGCWNRKTKSSQILPGTVILVDADFGGYYISAGWDPEAKVSKDSSLDIRADDVPSLQERADGAAQGEELSQASWKTIACHGREVAAEMDSIARRIDLDSLFQELLNTSALAHDPGKAHLVFQGSIEASNRPKRDDLAKAPQSAWKKPMYACDGEQRPGFRHELASALALFDVLRKYAPTHPALLGECLEYFPQDTMPENTEIPQSLLIERILGLQERWQFDLVAYLVASHHGKVRCSIQASVLDQDYIAKDGRGLPLRGVREGDILPPLQDVDGRVLLMESTLTLEPAQLGLSPVTGFSWSERVQGLLERLGPGALAYLEALLRAADIRASRLSTPDPLLVEEEL